MEAKSFLRGLSAHLLIVPAWVIPPGLLLGSLALAGAPLGAPGMLATLGTEPAVGLDSLRSYWSGPYERAQEVPTRRVAHSRAPCTSRAPGLVRHLAAVGRESP